VSGQGPDEVLPLVLTPDALVIHDPTLRVGCPHFAVPAPHAALMD
jgi:hypothetical protein